MALSRDEVSEVARLARLTLTAEEEAAAAEALSSVLDHVACLAAVDTGEVEPLARVHELACPLREDAPRPGLAPSEALRDAPVREDDLFVVPPVIEEAP